MRLIPGDNTEDTEYLWPIEPLNWWNGEHSIKYTTNPFPESELSRAMEKLLQERNESLSALEVDQENGIPYSINLETARGIFYEYASIGKKLMDEGDSAEVKQSLLNFMYRHGVPCDFVDRQHAFGSIDQIFDEMRDAASCVKLFQYAKKKRWSSISEMAFFDPPVSGQKTRLTFNFQTATGVYHMLDHRIEIQKIIQKDMPPQNYIKPQEWISFAFQTIEEVAAKHAFSLRVIGRRTSTGTQLVLHPSGLKTLLWLAFRLEIDDALELPKATKTCISNDRFHGCGRQFVPSNPRQKFCPECRAKAKAERQARWRAEVEKRKKQQAAD